MFRRKNVWTAIIITGMSVAAVIISACGPTPAPTSTQAPTSVLAPTLAPTSVSAPTPVRPVVSAKLDVGSGAPPSAGWKWAVAEINTTTQEVTDGPHEHDFAWIFYAVKGSAEVSLVSAADGKKIIAAGEGVLIPARQSHSHRYLPQSKVIAFHLRPADQPAAALHRGTPLLVSDKALDLKAGADYKVRIREFTFPPGSRTSENLTSDPNFGYLAEGTLTVRVGQTANVVEAGKPSAFPLNERYVVSNEGTVPLRLVLVDLHE